MQKRRSNRYLKRFIGKIRSTGPDEVAMILESANTIAIVPGYGLAVAQAQGTVRDLYNELTKDGKEVYFAIHLIAGRMPGHMNVLLAEVDIPFCPDSIHPLL